MREVVDRLLVFEHSKYGESPVCLSHRLVM